MALRGMAAAGLLSGPWHGMEASWGLAAAMRQIRVSGNAVWRGVGRGAWDGDGPRMQCHHTREGQKATVSSLALPALRSLSLEKGEAQSFFEKQIDEGCWIRRSAGARCPTGRTVRSYHCRCFFSSRETVTGRFAKPTRLCL
jgi:hypothetical protein